MNLTDTNKATGTEQYLTFTLDGELFACNVLKIREVLELSKIRKIPKTPDFISGVINLRGSIVPVIDLRKKFDFKACGLTADTSIIIVEVEHDGELIQIGALVDSVKLVIKIDNKDLEPPPKVGMNIDTDFISAIAKCDDDNGLIMILDIERAFSKQELAILLNEKFREMNGEDSVDNNDEG